MCKLAAGIHRQNGHARAGAGVREERHQGAKWRVGLTQVPTLHLLDLDSECLLRSCVLGTSLALG